MPENILGKSRPPFHVKLPCRTFESGVRGLMVHAAIPYTNADYCTGAFFCDDNTIRSVKMLTREAQKMSQHGPFVVLIEVESDAGNASPGLGIVSPDGTPLA